jgi:SH3-like domain-containing protein
VVLTIANARSLTVLESARALATAGVRQADATRLVATLGRTSTADPAELELAATLLYALAWQYVRRTEPGATWEDAQTWRVILDLEATDELADAEAVAAVDAAIVTGLPPAVAGELSLAQLEEYRRVHGEREARARRGRAG